MFCKNCGKESDGTKKFCTNCGNAFSSVQTNGPKIERPKRPPMPKEPWTVGRIIKTIIIVVFFGGLIFLKFGLSAINSIDNSAVETNNKAMDAYSSGNSDQAIAQFQQASQDAVTNTNKINSLKNLAYVYSSEGKDDLALTTFKQALALISADSFDYYLISGEIALLEAKPNAALLAYNKAYAKEPNKFQINNALNLFYLDIADQRPQYSDVAKALTYALKANEIQPSEITKQNLGIAYELNKNYKQAIYWLSQSQSKEPYVAFWLGLAYAADEQPVNAKRYLQIAVNGGVDVPQEVIDYIKNN